MYVLGLNLTAAGKKAVKQSIFDGISKPSMPAFINNRFVKNEEAVLQVNDLSIQRAYALFDFFRTVNAKPLFMEEHLQRFFHSAAAMHLPVSYSKEELQTIILQLIERSQLKEAGIRLMLTGGYTFDTYHPTTPNLVITCNPVKTSTPELFEKGITAISYEHKRELPHIKSINYLMAVWLQPLLQQKGVDDVLYHYNGVVTEFPRANLFVVTKEGKLITPAQNILNGITRNRVLKMAAAFMPVEERDVTINEVETAAEVFLTSTTRRVIPVVKMNDVLINKAQPGIIARRLWNAILEVEKQQL
jgi:D-alanine transaminase/branched-chain amino acid aminotransferase